MKREDWSHSLPHRKNMKNWLGNVYDEGSFVLLSVSYASAANRSQRTYFPHFSRHHTSLFSAWLLYRLYISSLALAASIPRSPIPTPYQTHSNVHSSLLSSRRFYTLTSYWSVCAGGLILPTFGEIIVPTYGWSISNSQTDIPPYNNMGIFNIEVNGSRVHWSL